MAAIAGSGFLPLSLVLGSPPWPLGRIALLCAILVGCAVIGWPLAKLLHRSHGPRHSLGPYILGWLVCLITPVLGAVLTLPDAVAFVVAAAMGFGLSALAASHVTLRRHFDTDLDGARIALAAFLVLTFALATHFVLGTPTLGFGLLAVLMAASLWSLAKLPDPVVPGPSPFGVYLPWRDHLQRSPARETWWTLIPAHLAYLCVTLVLFAVWIAVFGRDRNNVPSELTWIFVYEIPNLFSDVPRTLVNFATGIWFNHHPVQVVYVMVLLGLFGIWFEIHEGSRRAIAVFYGSSIFAGVAAGILLHVLRATFDAGWIDEAWTHAWNGGSAGAFGLAGAYAARAKRPWLLLTVVLFWEINVELWHLRSYTVAFHVAALACGYSWVRYFMPPRSRWTRPTATDAA